MKFSSLASVLLTLVPKAISRVQALKGADTAEAKQQAAIDLLVGEGTDIADMIHKPVLQDARVQEALRKVNDAAVDVHTVVATVQREIAAQDPALPLVSSSGQGKNEANTAGPSTPNATNAVPANRKAQLEALASGQNGSPIEAGVDSGPMAPPPPKR